MLKSKGPKQRVEKYLTDIKHPKDINNSFVELKKNLLLQVETLEKLHVAIYIRELDKSNFDGYLYQIKSSNSDFSFEYYLVDIKERNNFELGQWYKYLDENRVKKFRVKPLELREAIDAAQNKRKIIIENK